MTRIKHSLIDAHQIVPNLWQGSRPPPGDTLTKGGFHCLVLCAREFQPAAATYPNVRVIHAPNDDSAYFPLNRDKLAVALSAARSVALLIQQGKSCLVTCAAGMNRSGLVSALTLHLLYGWPGGRCIQQVREQRGPNLRDGYRPLSNPEFVEALQRLPAKGQVAASTRSRWKKTAGGILVPS